MQKAFSFKNLLRHVFAVVTLTSLFLVSTGCSSQAAQTEPVKETKPAAAAMADKSGKKDPRRLFFRNRSHEKGR